MVGQWNKRRGCKYIFGSLLCIVSKEKKEYLTEKQKEDCYIGNRFSFRYDDNIDERQHNSDDIINLKWTAVSMNELIELPLHFNIFVFEKPSVNNTPDVTKDGIHILFGLRIKDEMKIALRNGVLEEEKCSKWTA